MSTTEQTRQVHIFRVRYRVEELQVVGYLAIPAWAVQTSLKQYGMESMTTGCCSVARGLRTDPGNVEHIDCTVPFSTWLTSLHSEKWTVKEIDDDESATEGVDGELGVGCGIVREGAGSCGEPKLGDLAVNDPLPLFIYCRGGIGQVGKVKMNWLRDFAARDCVVFAPAYRGNEGSDGRDEFGGADCLDVETCVKLMSSLPFVDESRVWMMGFSRGSLNAARTALTMPSVQKLVLWGGVSDLIRTYEERIDLRRMLKRVVGGSPGKVPKAYERRSPITYVNEITCPILVIHGTSDVQVDFHHGVDVVQSRLAANLPVAFHAYQGYGHHLPTTVHQAVIDRMFDWLRA